MCTRGVGEDSTCFGVFLSDMIDCEVFIACRGEISGDGNIMMGEKKCLCPIPARVIITTSSLLLEDLEES